MEWYTPQKLIEVTEELKKPRDKTYFIFSLKST